MFKFFSPKSPYAEWQKKLIALENVAKTTDQQEWPRSEEVINILKTASKTLAEDLEILAQQDFIFPGRYSAGAGTQDIAGFLREWHITGRAPSLISMIITACENFKITSPDLVQSLLMAAALGDLENDLPYHNNLHFKKVVLQAIRLIAVHNDIYEGTARVLNEQQIAVLLVAGCIHDLGHDGLGNTIKGVFYMGRMERCSCEYAKPFLQKTGFPDDLMNLVELIVLTTDVAPLGDVANPMHQMKAAYKFHYQGDKQKLTRLNLADDFSRLESEQSAALLACLLHEADIATSAGINYAVTQFETCQYREEFGAEDARPSHIIDFLDKVCQRRFLSEAGQKLFGSNLARICALAEQEEQNGDQPFPKTQHTDFILGARGITQATDKTLN